MGKSYFLGLSRQESKAVFLIFLVLFTALFFNLRVSLRRSRDAQRKADLRSISDGVTSFQHDFSFFPFSKDGKILACGGGYNDENIWVFSECVFGESALRDESDPNYPPYLARIPEDPHASKGAKYYYESNGGRFQVYASLEGKDEAEYDPKIVARNLSCGNRICNFGLSFGKTPLDKSIEEYENELVRQKEIQKK